VLDQALHAAQRHRQCRQAHRLQERAARLHATLQLERDEGARTLHLPGDQFLLGVPRKAGIVDRRHGRVVRHERRHGPGVRLGLAHPQSQRPQPTQHQPCLVRIHGAAQVVKNPPHAAHKVIIAEDQDPTDHVGVAIQKLRHRMDHHVRAEP
jgi:hypothetical protein